MNFLELASDRYSVRSFSSAKVEDEKIDLILKAAQIAPTAVNYQPQRLYVVKSEEADASIITTHMMLEAWEQGIGSCWIASFCPSDVQATFNIPNEEIPVAILALGYPAGGCKPSDKHPVRKEIEEFTKYL